MKTKLINYKGCDNFIKILVNFVLGDTYPEEWQETISDINSDGLLNILDILLLVNIILY